MLYRIVITFFVVGYSFAALAQDLQIDPAAINNLSPAAGGEIVAQAEEPKKIDIIVLDKKSIDWQTKNEPEKSPTNLIRIKYAKNSVGLSDEDKLAISSMLKLAERDKVKSIKIKSFSSIAETPQKTRQKALSRVISLKSELDESGSQFGNNAEIIIYPSVSEGGSDYIDIDKM